MWRLPIRYS